MMSVLKYNSPETHFIVVACLTAIIVGASTPLFAILFGDILGVRILLQISYYRF